MERCPHCGAATRPGARFCTSCGTRLDDQAASQPATALSDTSATGDAPANTPETTMDDATQQTEEAIPISSWGSTTDASTETVADSESGENPVDSMMSATISTHASSDHEEEDAEIPADEGPDWASKWPDAPADVEENTSPADRFKDALVSADTSNTEPADDQPFPERTTWSWGAPAEETPAATEPDDTNTDVTNEESSSVSTWETPLGTTDLDDEVATESETIVPEPDAAGFSEGGQVDYLSGDESLSEDNATSIVATAANDNASGDDARTRATDLLDELRGVIGEIGEHETAVADANQTIITNMKRIRGETSDFSDLESIIAAVQENPRDIDVLRDLGQQVDRLHALLASHAALTSALDDAIHRGNRE